MTEDQLPKDNEEQKSEQQSKTSTGLDQNIAGLLSYLVGFVTGIIFLLLEKENRFVRFHALQSIFTFVLLIVINTVLGMIPLLGWFVSILIAPLTLVLWVFLMVKAYQGQYFKLPWIGDMVEQQLDK
ncbi:DUF4870 domain-containing protein [Gracilibacillus thailandensis]|uniref:DUF4870 domain-containing protein n=1 Tax=Gracilibacillus thailandensis TaxID=563735 RepID=A0A6N7R4V1_9BACI|nr:DUF4870 domain-containing protein [Gracilibacillus thailandensis]MRI68235.1 DUF4870 domain-containing protein [Gracilibacillus thailandensis]